MIYDGRGKICKSCGKLITNNKRHITRCQPKSVSRRKK